MRICTLESTAEGHTDYDGQIDDYEHFKCENPSF